MKASGFLVAFIVCFWVFDFLEKKDLRCLYGHWVCQLWVFRLCVWAFMLVVLGELAAFWDDGSLVSFWGEIWRLAHSTALRACSFWIVLAVSLPLGVRRVRQTPNHSKLLSLGFRVYNTLEENGSLIYMVKQCQTPVTRNNLTYKNQIMPKHFQKFCLARFTVLWLNGFGRLS